MTMLRDARGKGKLDDFVKEYEADPDGDPDKLDKTLSQPSHGSGKATRPASSQASSDD